MKKTVILALAAVCMAGCGAEKDHEVKGIIVDATMNTLMLVSAAGDTLGFSTVDAERISPDGILLGDTATVYFKGEAKPGEFVPVFKLVVAAAPRPEKLLVGSWVQPIPGIGGTQGVTLQADGTAASINMNTLQYEKWSYNGGDLVLCGKSIGNGQTIDFADTVKVEKVTADSLVLMRGDYRDAYSRQAE